MEFPTYSSLRLFFAESQLVVVVLRPGNPPKPPLGRRLAHAANAAATFGLEVVEVEVPDPGKPPPPLGNVTPWSFRQLR
jgi:hypothetical protein